LDAVVYIVVYVINTNHGLQAGALVANWVDSMHGAVSGTAV